MERRRVGVLLSAALVFGVLIGAAIAYTLLAQSTTMVYNVKAQTPLEWDKLGAPDPPLYRGIWYNTSVIHYNLTNNDDNQPYKIKAFIMFNASGPIDTTNVKAQYRSHKGSAGGYTGWSDVAFTTRYDPEAYAYGLFGDGLTLDIAGTLGSWIEFEIKFWISDGSPTGLWEITLFAYDYYDY